MLMYRCKQMKGKESSISWVLKGAHGRLSSEKLSWEDGGWDGEEREGGCKLLVVFRSFGFLVYYVILFYNRHIQMYIYVDIYMAYIHMYMYKCTRMCGYIDTHTLL